MGIWEAAGARAVHRAPGVRYDPGMRDDMFTVVVSTLADTVLAVIGPFWDEGSAIAYGERNVSRKGFRYVVKPITERGTWLAGIEKGEWA
jgi:hypothetical protein